MRLTRGTGRVCRRRLWVATGAALGAVALAVPMVMTSPAGGGSSALAQEALTIAAVVNDEAISMVDLMGRVRFSLITTGQPVTQEMAQRITPQVLEALITETLQLQEAKRLDVKVPEKEVNGEIEEIAQRNNMTREQFMDALRSDGIPPSTLSRQIEAQIAWSRAIGRAFGARTEVTPAEIEAELDQLRRAPPGEEYDLQEFFLAVDVPQEIERKRALVDRVAADLRRGVDFDALARDLSENPSRRNGGRIGWLRSAFLPPEIATRLATLQTGQTSPVIRSKLGFHIFRMHGRRAIERGAAKLFFELKQVFVPVPQGAPAAYAAQAGQIAAAASAELRGCPDIPRVLAKYQLADHSELGRLEAKDLPPALRNVVGQLAVGQATGPLRLDTGYTVLALCNRIEERTDLPSTEEVTAKLRNDRLSVIARRHMRDLRRSAIIDNRVGSQS